MKAFEAEHASELGSSARTVQQAIEGGEANLVWMKKNYDIVWNWLKNQNKQFADVDQKESVWKIILDWFDYNWFHNRNCFLCLCRHLKFKWNLWVDVQRPLFKKGYLGIGIPCMHQHSNTKSDNWYFVTWFLEHIVLRISFKRNISYILSYQI